MSVSKFKFPRKSIIISIKLKKISLNGELSPSNGIDTDKDTLTDWEEVNADELIELSDGNYTLPKVTLESLLETLKRYDNDEYLFTHTFHIQFEQKRRKNREKCE